MAEVAVICWSLVFIAIFSLFVRLLKEMWLKPKTIRSVIWKQGIRGPPPSFIRGNVPEMQKIQSTINNITLKPSSDAQSLNHNWLPATFPYLQQWTKEYGPVFLYSTGNKQHLYVSDPKLLKELKLHNSLDLGRPTYLTKPFESLLGNGLIRANGQHSAYQRKLIAPELFPNKVKGMLGLMEESTMELIETWERRILETEGGVVDMMINEDFKKLSADILSRACFGSSDYTQGNHIFEMISVLQRSFSNPHLFFGFLNFRFFPTKYDKIEILRKEVDALLLKLVRERQLKSQLGGGVSEKDLLQRILENATTSAEMPQHAHKLDRFVLDNCRSIYFAGSQTTALTASWTLMLLALHPEWQQRVRAEIAEVCGDEDQLHHSLQDMDALHKLKTLKMVIQETLRLYGPAVILARKVFANMKLGDFDLPEGIHIWTLVPALHRDSENWGPDADEFKPERFANGLSEACKYPQAYMPFGFGSRVCIGPTFATLQLKIILSHIVSKFSFTLSPNYQHAPVYKSLMLPEHGIRLLVRRV